MATGNTIEGGWTFTAFSNPESFSISVINGFVGRFESASMENVGVYTSNARDAMIQRWEDQRYIEAGNISLLHSHGNPWSGPSLEYVPPKLQWSGIYEWGEQGKLQWVALGGCDILGFATFPDGRVSPNSHPRPDRWKDMFKGISGVLGYRSASWYQKDNPGLGASTGAVFADALLNGMTFFEAWISAGDYLHRRIGRQAEVAVFLSSPDALQDTLASYMKQRRVGLDPSPIARRIVGSGEAPHYDYCEKVDDNGNWACNIFSNSPPTQLAENVWLRLQPQWFTDSYPVFECEKTEDLGVEIAGVASDLKWNILANGDLQSLTLAEENIQALSERIRQSEHPSGHVCLVDEMSTEDHWSAYRAVVIGDRQIRVFDDFGVVIERISGQTFIKKSPWTDDFSIVGSEELILLQDTIADRLRHIAKNYSWIIVDTIAPMYTISAETPKKLIPRLVAYLHGAVAGRVEHFVEFL